MLNFKSRNVGDFTLRLVESNEAKEKVIAYLLSQFYPDETVTAAFGGHQGQSQGCQVIKFNQI